MTRRMRRISVVLAAGQLAAVLALSLALALSALILGGATPAYAATFTVTNLNELGPGSLAQAILDANANLGPDTIVFDAAGTIAIGGFQLPDLSDGDTTIDGTTAPGYVGVPLVALRGPGFRDGLTITSANNEVRGLSIGGFNRGILITGPSASGNIIVGSYIGTDGVVAVPNNSGILINDAPGNRIGTDGDGVDDPQERNIISGNNSVAWTWVPFRPWEISLPETISVPTRQGPQHWETEVEGSPLRGRLPAL